MGPEYQVLQKKLANRPETGLQSSEWGFFVERFTVKASERLEALLTSFKTSPKSVVLLLISRAGGSISTKDLRKEFRSIYSGTEFGDVDTSTAIAYSNDLVSRGVVRRLFIVDGAGISRTIGFSLTNEGRNYAVPAASLALSFEYQNKLKLFQIFGTTHKPPSAKHGAPYNRACALSFLAKVRYPVREVELMNQLEMYDSVVSRTLDALVRAGVIDKSTGKRLATFVVNSNGYILYEKFLKLLEGLVDDNQLVQQQVMTTIVPEVTSNLSVYARDNLELYYYKSHSFKARHWLQKRQRTLEMLSLHSEGLSARSLAELVDLTPSHLQKSLLNPLIKEGQIWKRIQGNSLYYFRRVNPKSDIVEEQSA